VCGVFGVFGDEAAAELTYLGLYALQHRGQESAGMAVTDGRRIRIHKGMGLVSRVFGEGELGSLKGHAAIGHVRYSTTGAAHVANAQPLLSLSAHGQIALAHNGNLTNTHLLRAELFGTGSVFQTTTDSEVILHLIARAASRSLEEAVVEATAKLSGAYALVVMTNEKLIGLRDPLGIRPLAIGRRGKTWLLASESCAFDVVGGELVRDVMPGEMVVIDRDGLRSCRFAAGSREAFCVFEYIYFARSDSVIDGRTVHEVRKQIGRELARQHPIDADVVVPAPDSAISAALGYSEASGIPFDIALAKNRYVGRTFIQPSQEMRQAGVRMKLNPIDASVRNRRVVLVDDSIVRGTTSGKMIELLRRAGAREVHMVVASPPFSHPCYFGIDVPTTGELIASERSVDEIRSIIGADSLTYLSFEALFRAVGIEGERLCTACFGGGYPLELDEAAAGAVDFLEEERSEHVR